MSSAPRAARYLHERGDAGSYTPTDPVDLAVGRIADGEYLRRDGTEIRGDGGRVWSTSNQNRTSVTLADLSDLSWSVSNGEVYAFRAILIFRSAGLGVGLVAGLTCPAGVISARVSIPVAADGTAGALDGWITASGDSVSGTGVQATATDYLATIDGILQPTADGTLQLQWATSGAGTAVNVRAGSWLQVVRR